MLERRFAVLLLLINFTAVAGCNGTLVAPTKNERTAALTGIPTCTLTVVNGYPTSYTCNADAQAVQETLSCELEAFDTLGQLHGIRAGLPAAQITWWCQTEMASAIALNCTASATNPCAQIHIYPGIAVYDTVAAIQQALKLNLVPPVDTAPDGKPCPNGAGGDIGGVADMDGEDGPVVNWVMSRDNVVNYNAFSDGDFNNVAQRAPYYQGACTRPATHTIFLAQRVQHAADAGRPDSGCPTSHTPFALDATGAPNLTLLNQLRVDVACPTLADAPSALEAERQACLGIVADQQRIMRDGQLGLFPMAFTFVQLRRQYAAFVGLLCNAQFGLVDLNAGNCDPINCGPTTACGVNGCVGVCGTCAASNMTCDQSG
ncbi:MAG TPA: hypothetical protein VHB97_00900, partial [Polyangia bacterium]|nr:hypothetical protein [Polyangia bacterium]